MDPRTELALRRAIEKGDLRAELELRRSLEQDRAPPEPINYAQEYGAGTFERFGAGVGKGASRVAGAVGEAAAPIPDWLSGQFPSPQAKMAAQERQERERLQSQFNLGPAGNVGEFVGETAAAALGGGVIGGAVRAAAPVAFGGTLPMIAAGATEGALLSEPGDALRGAMIGGATGAGMNLLPSIGRGLTQGARRTPEAQTLLNRGVNLTPGQMNPGGIVDTAELASTSRMFPGIAASRQMSIDDTARAILNDAIPPGGLPVEMGSTIPLSQQLDEVYRQFDAAYRMIRPEPALVGGLGTRLQQTINAVPGATDRMRTREWGWLENQLTKFRGRGTGSATVGDLIDIRSDVRSRLREFGTKETTDPDHLTLLEAVEDTITEYIEANLLRGRPRPPGGSGGTNALVPRDGRPDLLRYLRDVDGQYRKYKIAEDMIWRRSDRDMTPNAMLQAVRQAEGRGVNKGRFARGRGGAQREIAAAGARTLSDSVPKTGMANLLPALGALGGGAVGDITGGAAGAFAPSAMAAILNTGTGRQIYRHGLFPAPGLQDLANTIGDLPFVGVGVPAARAAGLNWWMDEE